MHYGNLLVLLEDAGSCPTWQADMWLGCNDTSPPHRSLCSACMHEGRPGSAHHLSGAWPCLHGSSDESVCLCLPQENPIYLAKSERERIARGETVSKGGKKPGKK